MRNTPLFLLGMATALLCTSPAQAKTFGIVVGINHYQMLNQTIPRLAGAVNDAKLIEDSLRGRGAEVVVLTNEQATLANFYAAWRSVRAKAKPGDEIIFSFAGHGSQEEEISPPWDEDNHFDETFLFYDFNPKQSHLGRLSDDELHTLFAESRAYKIVFVADACHAGGMLRGGLGSPMQQRHGGPLGGYRPKPPLHDWKAPTVSDQEPLPHVTYLLATKAKGDSISEVVYQNRVHGALSVAFANAYATANPAMTRSKLLQYVEYTVARLSNYNQHPDMKPRGGDTPAFSIGPAPAPTPPPVFADLPISVNGGSLPTGVAHFRLTDDTYRLRFEIAASKVEAINLHGDLVAEFAAEDVAAWNRLINKYRLLDSLDARYNTAAAPVGIVLQEGDGKHPLGQRVNFRFDPGAGSDRRHFLLFDLAGNGQLQFLYPFQGRNHPQRLEQLPYKIAFDVSAPLGEDTVVALFCAKPQPEAIALLQGGDQGNAPAPETLLPLLGKDCQIGRYGFFTIPPTPGENPGSI